MRNAARSNPLFLVSAIYSIGARFLLERFGGGAQLPHSFVLLEPIPCYLRRFRWDGSVIWIWPALDVTDANVLSVRSINRIPILRSRSSSKDEWLMPTNLIYNKTACVVRREESKLARIVDPFQAIAARNRFRLKGRVDRCEGYFTTRVECENQASASALPFLRSLITKVLFSPWVDHGPRGTPLKSTNFQSVTSVSFNPR